MNMVSGQFGTRQFNTTSKNRQFGTIWHNFNEQDITSSVSDSSSELWNSEICVDAIVDLPWIFDDLNEDRNLGYRVRYCNSDWTISDLFYSEFIDGFQEEYLDDYEFSFNTIVDYANYGIVLPNKSLGFKLTGNYVIEVFDTESDLVLLSKRFMVAQAKVGIDHRIGRASLNSKLSIKASELATAVGTPSCAVAFALTRSALAARPRISKRGINTSIGLN